MSIGDWVECHACGGKFQPVQPDGTSYFHVCPTRRMVRAAEQDPVTGQVITPAAFEVLPDRRDERVVSHTVDEHGQSTIVIVSEGLGVSPCDPPAALALEEG